MQKNTLLLTIAISVCLSSCGFNQHKAQELYNRITGINDSLDMMTSNWHDLNDKAAITKNYMVLRPVRIALGSFISRNRSVVADVPRNKEIEQILAKETSLLEAQSAMVADVYPDFEQFTEFTPKEKMDKSIASLGYDLKNEKDGVADVNKLMQVLVKNNNLKKSTK